MEKIFLKGIGKVYNLSKSATGAVAKFLVVEKGFSVLVLIDMVKCWEIMNDNIQIGIRSSERILQFFTDPYHWTRFFPRLVKVVNAIGINVVEGVLADASIECKNLFNRMVL